MHRFWFALCLVLLLVGCDPAVASSFRLTPAPTVLALSEPVRANALAAVARLALRYGLAPYEGGDKECERVWFAYNYPRAPRQVRGGLSVCALLPADGSLEIRIAEGITKRWSPKADSLRHALADTLARFGTVRDSVIH